MMQAHARTGDAGAQYPALPSVMNGAEAEARSLALLRGPSARGLFGDAAVMAAGREPTGYVERAPDEVSAAAHGHAAAARIHHPLWAVRFAVRRGPRGLEEVLCLVDAVSGKAHMVADRVLATAVVDAIAWAEAGGGDPPQTGAAPGAAGRGRGARTGVPHRRPQVSADDAATAARAMAATAIRKRAKLAFLFTLESAAAPALVLKPN